MGNFFSDIFLGHARKFIPGWLQTSFDETTPSNLYPLRIVERRRKLYSTFACANYEDIRALDGSPLLKPYLKGPIVFGSLEEDHREKFIQSVEIAKNSIPNAVTALLAERGIEICVGKYLSHIDKLLEGLGKFLVGDNLDNGTGIFNGKHVCISQGFDMGQLDKKEFMWTDERKTIEMTLHELGHAVEYIVFTHQKDINATDCETHYRDFVMAYREDISRLDERTAEGNQNDSLATKVFKQDRVDIDYYVDNDHGGKHETESVAISEIFAQLFSETYSGLSQKLHKVFPETAGILDKIILSLEHLMEAAPNAGVIEPSQREWANAMQGLERDRLVYNILNGP